MDKEALRQKYREERDKRLREDGTDQYILLDGQLSSYKKDPYVTFKERSPKTDHVTFAYIGAGFAGLCTCASIVKNGVDPTEVRIIDKGGDVGGTWYWNRYPGAMCDTAAIVYMPLLEETGHFPSEKYAHGPEIMEQCQKIARKFDLYKNAMLHTEVKAVRWEEEHARWRVETDRGDSFTATFLGMGTGLLHVPKLPGVPGLERFKGHTFHTSRWDYDYTGGAASAGGEVSKEGGGSKVAQPLDKLGDKRVAIIGTGATGIQVVPHLAAACKELYVFQRTPSSVDVRGNVPLDDEFAARVGGEGSGWQERWMDNFCAVNTGRAPPGTEDLVKDGWTDLSKRIQAKIVGIPMNERTMDKVMEAWEEEDNRKMDEIRARCSSVVGDEEKAEGLKAWYRQLCKRPTFHDAYLQAFNRPTVRLVDVSETKGVEAIDETGLVAGGNHYEVDCIIYSSGFEMGTTESRKRGFEVTGQGGRTLSEHWEEGMRTLHGVHIHGFPNLFLMSPSQNGGYIVNVPHNYTVTSKAVGAVVSHALKSSCDRVELSSEEEEKWVQTILSAPAMGIVGSGGSSECTPGYYNNEGKLSDPKALQARAYPGGALAFFRYLQEWVASGKFSELSFSRSGSKPIASKL